jgi:MFS family permease
MSEKGQRGLGVFLTVWGGQVCSLIGSALTDFALGLWVYRTTSSITLFAFISMFAVVPQVVLAPVAGALADRWDRRKTMIWSNVAGGSITLAAVLLHAAGRLSVALIYGIVIGISTASIFLRPAFGSSTALLVPKEQLGRANGLVQSGLSVVQVLAPILGGVLMSAIDIGGILAMDLGSYVLATAALLCVRFPPHRPKEGAAKASIWSNMLDGAKYLAARAELAQLLAFMAAINVVLGMASVLVTPLVLSMASPVVLGATLSAGGIGMVAGSVLLTAWGGPKRRIQGVLAFTLGSSAFLVLTGVRPLPALIGVATFGMYFCQPIFCGLINVLLQSKVERSLQGRVFGMVMMVALSTQPVAFFLSGPLIERVFDPLLAGGGPFAAELGALLGEGPGRGTGLAFVAMGLLGVAIVLVALRSRRLRNIDALPDAGTQSPTPEPEPTAAGGVAAANTGVAEGEGALL